MGSALSRVLDAAEDASPVEAVEAVTRELGASLGATVVSFLISDLSGRALVRLSHVSPGGDPDDGHDGSGPQRLDAQDAASVLPFDGGPVEQALRTQTVQVLAPGQHASPDGGPTGSWRSSLRSPSVER